MASPFFFVNKKEAGKLRPCQDYRYLNDWTIKNAYPLPLISEIIDKLKGAKYFTKLDVRWGYNNIRIKEGDEWKAAFKTNRGLFEPTVMFFGMCNSPATFQGMMDSIFDDMITAKIEYLGMVIEEGKVSMDISKLKGIQDWPIPSTVKQVRGFLGFGNFYRRFIKNFSDIAHLLNDLLRKDKRFDWTQECQDAFKNMEK